jgi:hypothetical protein
VSARAVLGIGTPLPSVFKGLSPHCRFGVMVPDCRLMLAAWRSFFSVSSLTLAASSSRSRPRVAMICGKTQFATYRIAVRITKNATKV